MLRFLSLEKSAVEVAAGKEHIALAQDRAKDAGVVEPCVTAVVPNGEVRSGGAGLVASGELRTSLSEASSGNYSDLMSVQARCRVSYVADQA